MGEVAVVLGVSGGTGAAVARALARAPGLDVWGWHRGNHPEGAAALGRDVEALGRRCELVVADAAPADAAAEGARRIAAAGGRVKVLVHSLACASVGPLATGDRPLSPRQIHRTFEAMAHSFVHWARELHRGGLLAPSARLVALGNPVTDSLADRLGLIAASKGALEVYVRALAIELGPHGHRVNLLKFGLVDTRASRVAFTDEAWGAVLAAAADVTPAGRLVTVDEVGRLVSWLATDEAEWFNGSTLDFTGGMAQSLLNLVHEPERLTRRRGSSSAS